ncbi:MAG TPA: hypothetical protein VGM82_05780 [Gemmatimonadaceae bacterium]|jgi:hypothetical protein
MIRAEIPDPILQDDMLISQTMNDQMNAQIGHEFGASLQYMNIAAYFDDAAFPSSPRTISWSGLRASSSRKCRAWIRC